jgi:hypothetical protein
MDRLRREFVSLAALDECELWQAIEGAIYAVIVASLAFAVTSPPLPVGLSIETERLAEVWARQGLPLLSLTHLCRLVHAEIWQEWLEVLSASHSERGQQGQILRVVSTRLFEYFNRWSELVTHHFATADTALRQNRPTRDVELVIRLLDGRATTMEALSYDVSAEHVGLVAWGPEALHYARSMTAGEQGQLLAVSPGDSLCWGWLGGYSRWDAASFRKRRGVAPVSRDAHGIAFGTPGSGIEGFRRSHREAADAYTIGKTLSASPLFFEDVALEALAGSDRVRALEFVRHELTGLEGDDPKSVRLRETLEMYFRCSLNAAVTGARLGVHDQTVTYRLNSIEKRLGHSVDTRRAELDVALRLRRAISM